MMTSDTQEKGMFGFWVYVMSDCVLFAGLFATYAALNTATAGGPGPENIFHLSSVLIQTLLLLTSSFTFGLALLAAQHQRKDLVLAALGVTLLCGLSFLGLEISEFRGLVADGAGPQRSAFLSAFFALVGTHGLHIALGSLWMLVAGAHVALRGLSEATVRKLRYLGLFWHFLDIVWIFIFTFVYLLGVL